MKIVATLIVLLFLAAPSALAGPTEDIADTLAVTAAKPITPDSLPADFARLTKFVRHDGHGMVLFTDGGATDGYVRHAQAHFDTGPAAASPQDPLFVVAFEFVDQEDFSFDALSSALEQRLGTPTMVANQAGGAFRAWKLKQPAGRSLSIAKGHGSDNGDAVTVVQLLQDR